MEYAIAVGSNLGDRAAAHGRALALLIADGAVRLVARSRSHETAPVGGPPGQRPYLNAAWVVATGLGAHQLLHRLQAIEREVGRARTVADGPRVIDLDLVLARDGQVVASRVLILPHPRLHLRMFVLDPLAEVAGGWRHPRLGTTIDDLRARLRTARG